MKKNLLLTAVLMLLSCLTALSADELIEPKYYINGLYFTDVPKDILKEPGCSMSFTRHDGKSLCILRFPASFNLSEDVIATAIPADKIKDFDIIDKKIKRSLAFWEIMDYAEQHARRLKVGDKFPDFKAPDKDGVEISNKDFEGKVMVLNLWYTGCGPCRKEMPELSTWTGRFPDVKFYSSTWETPDVALPVLEKHGFNWHHLFADKQFVCWLNGLGFPMTIVVDKKGTVRHFTNGTNAEKLASIIEAIETCRAE